MCKESGEHKQLKEKAKQILISKGFQENEIFDEYYIPNDNGRSYCIDVVGIKNNRIFLIECGTLNDNKKKFLSSKFGEFLFIPYNRKLIEIDEKLWKKLEVYCLKQNLTISQGINKILSDFLKEKNDR